jgi:hypothetical protein
VGRENGKEERRVSMGGIREKKKRKMRRNR